MKKWLLLIAALLLLGAGFDHFHALAGNGKDADSGAPIPAYGISSSAGSGPESPDSGAKDEETESPGEKELTINVEEDQIREGNLLLVNQKHAVPEDEDADAEAVNLYEHKELLKGFGLLDTGIRLSPDMANKFSEMIEDAEDDGVDHFLISSGYRDEKKQAELYEQKGADYAMPPGFSEHNLGLSLDIGSSGGQMSEAPEGKWLKQNAWKYGFVLRYPADKTAITGIQYEPWHFRYVGLPHSAIMQEHGFVLEEYLDFLKENKSVAVTVGKQAYEVYYFPVSGNETLRVPSQGSYEVSGNNMDGVIVTVRPGS